MFDDVIAQSSIALALAFDLEIFLSSGPLSPSFSRSFSRARGLPVRCVTSCGRFTLVSALAKSCSTLTSPRVRLFPLLLAPVYLQRAHSDTHWIAIIFALNQGHPTKHIYGYQCSMLTMSLVDLQPSDLLSVGSLISKAKGLLYLRVSCTLISMLSVHQ